MKLAVRTEKATIPNNIHRILYRRAGMDLGAVSPYLEQKLARLKLKLQLNVLRATSTYPTVVMVTKAHQKPCHVPRIKEGGKSTGFLCRSYVE